MFNRMMTYRLAAGILAFSSLCLADSAELPHGQRKPPGPALSAEEAIAKMQLPPGFAVQCVAHEPDLINPTSFTFDDQGRMWVTESVEYPRESAGPGQDRIKIFESTHHDGNFDKVSIFADKLNIPCGVAIGNGGVYVTNSPDILFYPDCAVSGKATEPRVILSGFGRADRHELPNSLTWGPDGWLYGMNGVFNGARIQHDGKTFDFTCAIWRFHPVTQKFELFAQGTSNPWGLDYNRQGDWFVSCCVIDHLFHMTESGYYQRQGGPYPPATHWLPSITTGRHQAAAYAGLCILDTDVFPEPYRGKLLMGNLHGSAINCDSLTRNGSTYVQHNEPDFLQANDAWFMPVAQKIGPDGCLYVMDWYDRYHCYQDANRDPAGIDRERGRIYRISYGGRPFYPAFDLQKASADELLKLLDHPDIWNRRTAQRILIEKFSPDLVDRLEQMALDRSDRNNGHMHALWTLVSHREIRPPFHLKLLASDDEPTRNWGVRAAGEMSDVADDVLEKLRAMSHDPSADVRCQLAVTAGRLPRDKGLPILLDLLRSTDNAKDPLIPTIVYNNLRPWIADHGGEIAQAIENDPAIQANYASTVARWVEGAYNMARSPRQIADTVSKALEKSARESAFDLPGALNDAIDGFENAGVPSADRGKYFDPPTRERIAALAASTDKAHLPATIIALWWNDPQATAAARGVIADASASPTVRAALLKALAGQKSAENIPAFASFVADNKAPVRLRQGAVSALGAMGDSAAAEVLVDHYAKAEPADLKPMILDALVQTQAGSAALLDAVASRRIPSGQVTENHARRIAGYNDAELSKKLAASWGTIRTDRNPERAQVAEKYKKIVLSRKPGDPLAGQAVFRAKCMQCHTIYGAGGNVGPDITGVGRDNLDLILSNVLDPNLVVGKPYYQWVVRLKNGTVANGILAEENDRQIVLKDGTQLIAIPRDTIEKMKETTLSMMPEGLEATMSEEDFVNLVAFLLKRQPPKPWSEWK